MTPATLSALEKLENLGGKLRLEGDRLKILIPKTCPEPEPLVAEIRAHRQELIADLRERERQGQSLAPCGSLDCAGCYEVEPGRHLHPPRPSQDWLDWLARWQKSKDERIQ